MRTTRKLATEFPHYVEQYGFNENSMAMTSVAMVLSVFSLHYVMKILLGPIKAYDLTQKDQVMAIVDGKHSVTTVGMMASLLQPSTVAIMSDEFR